MTANEFIRMVANFTLDGEVDETGEAYAQQPDDAIETLIAHARDIYERGEVSQ